MDPRPGLRAVSAAADLPDRVARICAVIRKAIIERALSPGDKLPEDSLGESFSVSRTIARQALGQLAAEGLVDLRRNRIAVVATPTPEETRDTFEIRAALEEIVARHLAGKLGAREIETLRAHVAAQDEAEAAGSPSGIRLATEFHVLLASMAARPVLHRYVSEVAYRSGLALSAYGRPHSTECAIAEHRSIVDALEAGDADAAGRAMAHHLDAVVERALTFPPESGNRNLAEILAPFLASG
ncbi:GntR family transcriptional regulator [Aureimonas mangrovi]|uniref:GntR family transcriptional regulator n=1 Tax=Aureimonas mangrovi TaxID=2758041 RepID=UPI00163DD5B3|nr:GntR family transcriptional regulator [Aureimonas mangrovi]